MKKLVSLLMALCMMVSLAACGGQEQTTDEGGAESDNGGYKIAFSNSYVGNAWRTAAVNIFDAYTADLVEQGVLSKAYSSSAGDDVQAQINENPQHDVRGL
ncbi:MAG: hypothetical protein V8R40_04800 [Dysosmobacter sp.]